MISPSFSMKRCRVYQISTDPLYPLSLFLDNPMGLMTAVGAQYFSA